MNAATHTPGPWFANHGAVNAQDVPIALADDYSKSQSEREANARLIAAAPDMLAALRGIFVHLAAEAADTHRGHVIAALETARAAITKAEGA